VHPVASETSRTSRRFSSPVATASGQASALSIRSPLGYCGGSRSRECSYSSRLRQFDFLPPEQRRAFLKAVSKLVAAMKRAEPRPNSLPIKRVSALKDRCVRRSRTDAASEAALVKGEGTALVARERVARLEIVLSPRCPDKGGSLPISLRVFATAGAMANMLDLAAVQRPLLHGRTPAPDAHKLDGPSPMGQHGGYDCR
jgi:hypothetical protein